MKTDNPPDRVIRIIADMIGGVGCSPALPRCSAQNVSTEHFTA
nr:MAG TPA: hypothetical protein [Caudoviricetes sp.]